MHARFPPPRHKTRAADCNISPAATQTANREMLCSLENINIPLCGHTRNGVVYLCQFAHFGMRLPVASETIHKQLAVPAYFSASPYVIL